MGIDAILPARMAQRPFSLGVLESGGEFSWRDHWWPDLLPPDRSKLPARSRVHSPGSRPAQHLEPRVQCKSSLELVRFNERVLWIGIHKRNAERAISGKPSSAAHHIRSLPRQNVCREILCF